MSTLFLEILDGLRQNPRLVAADDFEISLHHYTENRHRFLDGETQGALKSESLWVRLRLIHRRQPGVAAATVREPAQLNDLVERAFQSARMSAPDPWFRFPLWRKLDPSTRKSHQFVEYPSLFGSQPETVLGLRESYSLAREHILVFRKTEKVVLRFEKDVHGLDWGMVYAKGPEPLQAYCSHKQATLMEGLDQKLDLWKEELERTSSAIGTFTPRGHHNLVLGPKAVCKILERTWSWFSASSLHEKKSPFSLGKEGGTEKVASEVISLVDDGTDETSANFSPFDFEGNISQRTVLIESGFRRNALYDSYYATRDNRRSTANHRHPVGADQADILPTLFRVLPGRSPLQDLISIFGSTLWLEDLSSVGTDGDKIEVLGRGWLLKNGAHDRCFAEIRVSLSFQDLLRRAVLLSRDLETHGVFSSPSILFEKLPL